MKSPIFYLLLLITFGLLAWGTYQALVVAPPEVTMGDAQRIFYYHVPAATAASILFGINFFASLWYLWKRDPRADALAVTGAEVGVVFFGVVLVSGPIWARYAWGTFWVWDARLTTSLILWLVYVSYLVLRSSSESGATSTLASVFAVFGFATMPIVYMSNRWFPTNHPQPIIGNPDKLNPEMGKVLMWNMLAFVMFGLLIAWFRYELERTGQKINALHIQKAARGSMTMVVPALFLFADDKLLHEKMVQHRYMIAGYIAVWTVYLGYLLFLFTKLQKLKREGKEVGLGQSRT